MTSNELGTIADLPNDYRERLTALNTVPLWPSLRSVLPYNEPSRRTQPVMWRYADVRPQLLRAGDLTPIEKAERRVLVLCNPGLGLQNMQATPSIYVGLQLILPGEMAPCHRHSPSAVRFVIEGSGGFTVVSGEKLPMERRCAAASGSRVLRGIPQGRVKRVTVVASATSSDDALRSEA